MDDTTLLFRLNKIREKYGMYYLRSLPKGVVSDCAECVWANALRELDPDIYVGSDCVEIARLFATELYEQFGVSIIPVDNNSTRVIVGLNLEAQQWLADFDEYKKPLLIV